MGMDLRTWGVLRSLEVSWSWIAGVMNQNEMGMLIHLMPCYGHEISTWHRGAGENPQDRDPRD